MIQRFFLRAFVRSTEDPRKVLQAVRTVVPWIEEGDVSVSEHKGVYGNVFLSIIYEAGKREARKIWEHVWNAIEEDDRELLRERIEEFLDEFGQIHLRFDKQEAYKGKLVLGTSGVIKVVFKLEAYPAKYENFLRIARKLVGG